MGRIGPRLGLLLGAALFLGAGPAPTGDGSGPRAEPPEAPAEVDAGMLLELDLLQDLDLLTELEALRGLEGLGHPRTPAGGQGAPSP
jgi:hypothetical protein